MDQRLMTVRILWFAIFASTFMFVVVRFVMPAPSMTPEPLMLPGIGIGALVAAVLSWVLPRKFGDQAARSRKLEITEVDDPGAASDVIPGGAGAKRRVFADRKAALGAAFGLYQTPFILGLALSEAVAIFGFMLWQLGFGLYEGLPFFVVAWILIALRFPTLEKVMAPFERVHGAVLPPS